MRNTCVTFLALSIVLSSVTGCVRGAHILTGKEHAAVSADSVQLYQGPPSHYEAVGFVNARTRGTSQRHVDRVTRELKKQAAKLGANGVILNPVQHSGLAGRKLDMSGQAIYVLP